ncbi:hypothetical protein [Clostridium sp. VAP23]|uniref:hypothetical protein n=1 Tax=Clostridium sp. VAP23 TaxID=2949981 RepID=UPI0020793F3F|nr:hypothetical protein [Clostridium sp. VAP23]
MKIGIIQATSQKNKNDLLYNCVKKAVKDKGYEVINFAVFKVYSMIKVILYYKEEIL